MKTYPTSFRNLGSDLAKTVALQVILAVFAPMMLDGGLCLAALLFFIVLHWIVVIIIAARRFNCMTKVDVILVRTGFLLYLVGSVGALMLVGFVLHLMN